MCSIIIYYSMHICIQTIVFGIILCSNILQYNDRAVAVEYKNLRRGGSGPVHVQYRTLSHQISIY